MIFNLTNLYYFNHNSENFKRFINYYKTDITIKSLHYDSIDGSYSNVFENNKIIFDNYMLYILSFCYDNISNINISEKDFDNILNQYNLEEHVDNIVYDVKNIQIAHIIIFSLIIIFCIKYNAYKFLNVYINFINTIDIIKNKKYYSFKILEILSKEPKYILKDVDISKNIYIYLEIFLPNILII